MERGRLRKSTGKERNKGGLKEMGGGKDETRGSEGKNEG
jgi:hypothetical protein